MTYVNHTIQYQSYSFLFNLYNLFFLKLFVHLCAFLPVVIILVAFSYLTETLDSHKATIDVIITRIQKDGLINEEGQ